MNSCLSYEVKFVLKFSEAFDASARKANTYGYGRYYVKNNILYYRELKPTSVSSNAPTYPAAGNENTLAAPVAIALWPMNACCVLDKTAYTAAGNTYEDEHVNRLRQIGQLTLCQDY